MSTEASTSAAEAANIALPQVRKPGRVPIKSWALDVEGSALEQAMPTRTETRTCSTSIANGTSLSTSWTTSTA